MKNTMSFCLIFSFLFTLACGDSSNKKSATTNEPTTKAIAKKTVEPAPKINEAELLQPEKAETASQKTASDAPMTIAKKTTPKPAEKAKNNKNEPTKLSKTASVNPTSKTESPIEKAKKITETTPKIKTPKETPKPTKPQKTIPNHSNWNTLLQKNVSASGKVNYQNFKAQKPALQNYLDELAANPPADDWSKKEKMAYWINAYNAFTIKLIVDNYPVKSITDLEGGKPWDKKWIKLGGKTYSLNNIENDILRPKYQDARIHFAVNCAAKSCPTLLNKAWTANNLNANFDKMAKAFINNVQFNKISVNSVEISKIFDWYKEDFGNIIDYLNKYSTTKINANAEVSYKEYDWALNE